MDDDIFVPELILCVIIVWIIGFVFGWSIGGDSQAEKLKEMLESNSKLTYQVDNLNTQLEVYQLRERLEVLERKTK